VGVGHARDRQGVRNTRLASLLAGHRTGASPRRGFARASHLISSACVREHWPTRLDRCLTPGLANKTENGELVSDTFAARGVVQLKAHCRTLPDVSAGSPARYLWDGLSEIPVVGDLADRAYRDHYDQVLRFARRRTATIQDAEDIAQSVFAEAAARLETFKPGRAPVLAWLYTVTQRRLVDQARRELRRPEEAIVSVITDARVPEYGREVAAMLRLALERLPDRQRAVVVARLIEGATFAEIASRIGATEAGCKMRFARGIATVRDYLTEEGVR
jgi:RNA polymerase sigma factor (sigma-70 family)